MTFHIGLHEMCVRTGVRYVITKFSGEDSLPNFLTHGAPLRARFARARSSAKMSFHLWTKWQALLTGGTQLPINTCQGLVVLILSLCVVCAVRACVSYLCIIYLFLFLFFNS